MDNKKLGIYFGSENLSLVEVAGARVRSALRLPLPPDMGASGRPPAITGEAPSIAVPSDVKLAALISGVLRDNRIEAKKTILGLSSRDQFIRGFQMLLLSKQEMETGVLFEIKKYISSKTEDLAFDYQRRSIKKSSKMDILFVAANRNSLKASRAILNQAGLEVAAVEPDLK